MVRESRARLTNQRLQLEEVRWGGENVILGPPGRLSTTSLRTLPQSIPTPQATTDSHTRGQHDRREPEPLQRGQYNKREPEPLQRGQHDRRELEPLQRG
jgi:hypothetical protein